MSAADALQRLVPAVLVLWLGLPLGRAAGAQGQQGPSQAIPLQCRLAGGSWKPCRMEVIELGSHWILQIGERRLEFRHDGRGAVTMQAGSGQVWRPVSSRWEDGRDLCWDGVCTRGPLPLD
jgi:hypothetical protein